MADIAEWIDRTQAGEAGALDGLFAAAYGELKRLARARLRGGGRSTVLDTTGLVHEFYLRGLGSGRMRAQDRHAFFGYASRVMRSVIVDTVRERLSERRGGDLQRLTLDSQLLDSVPAGDNEILEVDQALRLLAQAEPRLAQVVEMRYFGGFSELEVAQALGIAERTVRRDWEKARLLLVELLAD